MGFCDFQQSNHKLKQFVHEQFSHIHMRRLDGFKGSEGSNSLRWIPSRALRWVLYTDSYSLAVLGPWGFFLGDLIWASYCLWWMHINSPPMASKGLLRKSLRNYFGFNSDIRFSYKRSTAKHWLCLVHLLEALGRPFLRHFWHILNV